MIYTTLFLILILCFCLSYALDPDDGIFGFNTLTCPDVVASLDGSCNNIANPNQAKSNTPFRRITEPCYDDGLGSMRGTDSSNILPSARLLSNNIMSLNPLDDEILTPTCLNDLTSHFGQFINHDIHASGGGRISSGVITVPEYDQWLTTTSHVPFERAAFEVDSSGIRQQLNLAGSGLLDLSVVYGSNDNINELVDLSTGELLVNDYIGGQFPSPLTVFGLNILNTGDGLRASQQNALLSLQVLAVREHNYWVKKFTTGSLNHNKNYTPFSIFHLARRMTIGCFQKAFLQEWIPAMTGVEPFPFNGYNDTCDPSPATEVANVAWRMGHSGTREFLYRYDYKFRLIDDDVPSIQKLVDSAFKPEQMYNNTYGMEAFLRGSIGTQAGKFDLKIVDSIRNLLIFDPPSDLVSVDIQRARDHGICGYKRLCEMLGISVPTSFNDLNINSPEARYDIATNYNTIEDVDPIIGLLQEDKINNKTGGEMFNKLMIDDLVYRIQHCDRYYWENNNIYDVIADVDPAELINEIRNTKFSDIIRRNSKINGIQLERAIDSLNNMFILKDDRCLEFPI